LRPTRPAVAPLIAWFWTFLHIRQVLRMKAIATVQLNDDRVIVTHWRFAPGAETGHHVHAYDYVVVPLTTGTLRLEEPTGPRDVRLQVGASYGRPAGVAHNVINVSDGELSFVEIELK
jgi:quercetin dioxygenase-like cupin family protein